VLVSPDRTVLSTGYNGFIRDIDDTALPNLRPTTKDQLVSKYDFMIHAEHNAILNCARQGRSTVGATAYITGHPCNWCLQYMWQAGIVKIVYSDWSNPTMIEGDKHKKVRQALLELMNPYCNEFAEEYKPYRIKIEFVPSSEINFQ
jgi:dCMP deaminase